MNLLAGSDPILDCAAAAEFERNRFDGDTRGEWSAMNAAGRAVGRAMLNDLRIAGVLPHQTGRVLVLVGKGHNGGDALLAAAVLLERTPWMIEVGFVFGQNKLRPLTLAAWRDLQTKGGSARVRAIRRTQVTGAYTAIIDGVFGFQFRPPLAAPATSWLASAQQVGADLRAAVDLPSGLAEEGAFRADATYATGILKRPLLSLPNAGRLRYLDLGFFTPSSPGALRVLTPRTLASLNALRRADGDKRTFGQLAVIAGSRSYPGAVGMTVAAALHTGVGNVTAFVPESIAPAFASRWPEAMWMGCAETEDGGIAMEAGITLRRHLKRATALVIGPGLGREPETLALVADIIREAQIPLVLDADALQPDLVNLGSAARILTPHQGEFDRIAAGQSWCEWESPAGTLTVLKGPITRILDGSVVYHGLGGGPVLARGGSGDILAGLIGGRLAASPASLLLAAAQGVVWQGIAAQSVAEQEGEVAVRSTHILSALNSALRRVKTDESH